MTVQPYLFFGGRCEEAIEFYREVFGAELTFLMRYKDGPPELVYPGGEEKVFHASVRFGETTLSLADTNPTKKVSFGGFALLAKPGSVEVAEREFIALADGGHVHVPLAETFWAARYGIVADRFGVTWKIQVDFDKPNLSR